MRYIANTKQNIIIHLHLLVLQVEKSRDEWGVLGKCSVSLSLRLLLLCSAGERHVWTSSSAGLALSRAPSSSSAPRCPRASWCSARGLWWDSGRSPQVRKSKAGLWSETQLFLQCPAETLVISNLTWFLHGTREWSSNNRFPAGLQNHHINVN